MARNKQRLQVYKKKLLIILLILVNTLLVLAAFRGATRDTVGLPSNRPDNRFYPEVNDLSSRNLSFQEISSLVQSLARTKGPEYAYEVLRFSKLPDNTDLHLLGHIVGDVLFRKYGASGMRYCTDEFRNACSHAIVVGLYATHGESVLTHINEACRQAPGGSGAYTMCYHGLGHGILAAADYDLAKAVDLCRKTATGTTLGREFPECVGGTIMEFTSGGFHSQELWAEQMPKYFNSSDPFAPCSTDLIPIEAKELCFEYLTPHLVRYVDGDIATPDERVLYQALQLCTKVTDSRFRMACYKSFGKEFVVLVAKRDIRSLESMTDEELSRIYALCRLADDSDGTRGCMTHAVDSLFWGGENERKLSERFCALVTNNSDRSACFTHLIGVVHFYVKDQRARDGFCKEIPTEFYQTCSTWSAKFGV